MSLFTTQYRPAGSTRVQTLRAGSWDAAAHQAVALARAQSRDVTILRFDRTADAGWSIAGLVRDMEGHTPEPHVYLLQDLRSVTQRERDLTDDRAASVRRATLDAEQPTGWRSRMRVLGAAGRPFVRA